jgi:hypothetical protein
MLKFLLLCINICTASTNLPQINRLRRQSPFLDGIQPPVHKHEARRVLSLDAHRKSEA